MRTCNNVSRVHLGEIILNELTDHDFLCVETTMTCGERTRYVIYGLITVWNIDIVRNYVGDIPRLQTIEVRNLDGKIWYSKISITDLTIVEDVLIAIDALYKLL